MPPTIQKLSLLLGRLCANNGQRYERKLILVVGRTVYFKAVESFSFEVPVSSRVSLGRGLTELN